MLLLLFLVSGLVTSDANALSVNLVTPKGVKVIREGGGSDFARHAKKSSGRISVQEWFDAITASLDLNDKADIDLMTLYGADGKTARVPRFMIWRGFIRFRLSPDGTLESEGDPNRLLVPRDFFTIKRIQKVEFSRASDTYPGTALAIRTNPAASRGEKLFTQSCMACHSIGSVPRIDAQKLSDPFLKSFNGKHRLMGSLTLDSRAIRGLAAYRDALASGRSGVKSGP
jgi:hypothetical protein